MPLIEDAALDQELERFEKDMQWIYDHYQDLKRQYPDQFVAVLEGKVAAHNSDIDQLVQELKQRYGDRAGEIAIRFIYREPPNMVLTPPWLPRGLSNLRSSLQVEGRGDEVCVRCCSLQTGALDLAGGAGHLSQARAARDQRADQGGLGAGAEAGEEAEEALGLGG